MQLIGIHLEWSSLVSRKKKKKHLDDVSQNELCPGHNVVQKCVFEWVALKTNLVNRVETLK